MIGGSPLVASTGRGPRRSSAQPAAPRQPPGPRRRPAPAAARRGPGRARAVRELRRGEGLLLGPFVSVPHPGVLSISNCRILMVLPWRLAALSSSPEEPARSAGLVRCADPLHHGVSTLCRERVVGSYKPVVP